LLTNFRPAIARYSAVFAATFLLVSCSQEAAAPVEGASPLRVRLLTGEQYSNMIASVFGEDVAAAVNPPLPPLARTDGLLAGGASAVGVTSDQISQIQQAAAFIGAKVVDDVHRDFLIPCRPANELEADDTCAAEFLRETSRLLYRRPVDETRVAELIDIAGNAANETRDFYTGLALALESMLISPEVLFIVDRAEPDPADPTRERLDSYSIASRLSFFLWNAPPDDQLLLAAERGELRTEAGLRAAVERMLSSSRLKNGMRAFFDDMLTFDEFDSLAKDPMIYPMVTGATLADAREQTLRTMIDHLLSKELDYRDLFTTRDTFMSMPLAAVYGVPTSNGWVPFTFDEDSMRAGLLTHVSFLAANSHAVRSSPTLRGRALREVFLCQKVPDPPPNVDFSALEDAGDVATARERLQVHNTNPSCAGCHLITDPMGLSLENFDGAGRFRATENGVELDISGELDGAFYDDVAGLTQAMREHPKLSSCLVNRLYAYGTGGPVTLRYDRDLLAALTDRFAASGHRLPELLRDIALSPAFTTVRPAEPIESSVVDVSTNAPAQPTRDPEPGQGVR
jgi:hypothetical protein